MGHNLEPAAIPGAVPGFPFGRAQVNDCHWSFSLCPKPVSKANDNQGVRNIIIIDDERALKTTLNCVCLCVAGDCA